MQQRRRKQENSYCYIEGKKNVFRGILDQCVVTGRPLGPTMEEMPGRLVKPWLNVGKVGVGRARGEV